MPVVPFSTNGPTRPKSLPDIGDPWVLMAAAIMDAQGRLLEPTRAEEDVLAEEDTTPHG